ncbi:MAG: helix-turn-helix domain-containing protein [Prevotella sp.]|nr:helix-turn-helix domain-containing protein [Prevotella sp.]
MKKKANKKKADKVKVIVEYGISVPEKALFDIIKFDAAGILEKFFSKKGTAFSPEIKEIADTVVEIVKGAQELWGCELLPYIEKGTSPADEDWVVKHTATPAKLGKKVVKPLKKIPKKTGAYLSEAETKRIRSLRAKGMSIKAIGKAIHRSDKTVSAYLRTLKKAK